MIFSLTPSGGRGHLGDESWKLLRSGEGEGLQLLDLLIDSVPFCPLHIIYLWNLNHLQNPESTLFQLFEPARKKGSKLLGVKSRSEDFFTGYS